LPQEQGTGIDVLADYAMSRSIQILVGKNQTTGQLQIVERLFPFHARSFQQEYIKMKAVKA